MKNVPIIILVLSFSFILFAGDQPIITVLDFQIEEGISKSEMRLFISLLTSALFKTKAYVVIDVNERDKLLEEIEFAVSECSEESCQLEIGRLLAAEAIVIGRIGQLETKYILTVKILQTDTGRVINTVDGMYENLEAMVRDTEIIAGKIAGIDEGEERKPEPVSRDMVFVEGGKFRMGSNAGDNDDVSVIIS